MPLEGGFGASAPLQGQSTVTRKHTHPVLFTPTSLTVHLSQRVPAMIPLPRLPSVRKSPGIDADVVVLYATSTLTAAGIPHKRSLPVCPATSAVPLGTASVMVNWYAVAVE